MQISNQAALYRWRQAMIQVNVTPLFNSLLNKFRYDKPLNRGKKQSFEGVFCYRKDNPVGMLFLSSPSSTYKGQYMFFLTFDKDLFFIFLFVFFYDSTVFL